MRWKNGQNVFILRWKNGPAFLKKATLPLITYTVDLSGLR